MRIGRFSQILTVSLKGDKQHDTHGKAMDGESGQRLERLSGMLKRRDSYYLLTKYMAVRRVCMILDRTGKAKKSGKPMWLEHWISSEHR
ncbi:MAG: hypothetical protein CM15mP8_4780 [Methanobacteriota archaeon]|nr:MAG: hypothetical protein CM15mP8_4780 [Euryarchaeota archaeon]